MVLFGRPPNVGTHRGRSVRLATVEAPTTLAVVALATSTIMGAACHQRGAHAGPPQHYDNPRAMIEVFEDDQRDAWQMPQRVVRSLGLVDRHGVVADIGAGSGYFTRRLANEVPEGRVYAVDVDGEFEDYLLEQRESWGTPNIEPHLAHYDDPMLPIGAFDLIFTANTYAFIRNRVAYFTKVRQSIRPDGRLAIIDFRPDATPPGDIAPDPEHRVTREDAVAEIEQAGFVLEREESFLPYQWFLVFKPK